MSEESEHDNVYDDLHHAFGAEVADLSVGATPVGAVMSSGAALRVRRRLTAVSGVAALAVLPVAAVAIFAGGGGGGNGNGGAEAGGRPSGYGTTADHTPSEPGGTTRPGTAKTPTSSPTIVLPQQTLGGNTTTPDPLDVITVVGSGVTEGHPWRLVRDEYVVAMGPGLQSTFDQPHLPMWRLGSTGTGVCLFVGVQWGVRPPGTRPDFNAAGQCSKQKEAVTGPLSLGPSDGSASSSLWALIGQVGDTSKVAEVSVAGPRGITAPQAIFPVPGERDGYYVVFLPPLTDEPQHTLTITSYDTGGHVVARTNMN